MSETTKPRRKPGPKPGPPRRAITRRIDVADVEWFAAECDRRGWQASNLFRQMRAVWERESAEAQP